MSVMIDTVCVSSRQRDGSREAQSTASTDVQMHGAAVPAALIDGLSRRLGDHYYNSLSAALLLRALDSYGADAERGLNLRASAWLAPHDEQPLSQTGKPPRGAVPFAAKRLVLQKEGDAPAFYLLSELGYDRGVPQQAVADGLEATHEYLDLQGQPLKQVRVGDEFLVRVRLRAKDYDEVEQVAVVDLLPGGVEPVYNLPPQVEASSGAEQDSDAETESEASSEPAWQPPVGEAALSDWQPEFADVRDDRVVLYGTVWRNAASFTYRVRATNAGTFNTPPAHAEGMYDTRLRARGTSGQLEIVKP